MTEYIKYNLLCAARYAGVYDRWLVHSDNCTRVRHHGGGITAVHIRAMVFFQSSNDPVGATNEYGGPKGLRTSFTGGYAREISYINRKRFYSIGNLNFGLNFRR